MTSCKNFSDVSAAAVAAQVNTFLKNLRRQAISISVVNNGGTWEAFLIYQAQE